jgi:thiamine-phosphate pyrophosphorylase
LSKAPRIGRLHVITDVTVQKRYTHEQLAALAAAGGADTVQFREKRMKLEGRFEVAARMKELCERFQIPLIVNDSIDVSVRAGADGVHLGRDDISVTEARRILGDDVIIGATAGTLAQAIEAEAAEATYVGFGHVFDTRSKQKHGPPVGLEKLREVCERLTIPVIAVGGIDAHNAREVIDAGAYGIAVIGAICSAVDPSAAADRLLSAIGSSDAAR